MEAVASTPGRVTPRAPLTLESATGGGATVDAVMEDVMAEVTGVVMAEGDIESLSRPPRVPSPSHGAPSTRPSRVEWGEFVQLPEILEPLA